MANEEYVAMLKQGVAAWNAWRERDGNIYIRPDLSGANLSRQDFDSRNPGRMGLRSFHRAELCGPMSDDVRG